MEPESTPEQPAEPTEPLNDKPKTFWINVKKKPSELKFHPKNPRIITEAGIDKMQESLAEFGYAEPVLVNLDDVLIAGHKRIAALLDWELDDEIDVRVPNRLLSPDEHLRLMLIDNKMEENNWNWDMLNNEFDLELLKDVGFTDEQLSGFVPDEPIAEPDNDPTKPSDKKMIQCPKCGEVFEV